MKSVQAIILATGLGTGLRPLSLERPKTLTSVCNLGLLRRLLESLQEAGFRKAVVVIRPSSIPVQELFKAEAPPGFRLSVVVVPDSIDGTVPVVREVRTRSASPCLVIYGDSLIVADFRDFLRFHEKVRCAGGIATILVHQPKEFLSPPRAGRTFHGVLSMAGGGRVTRFKEKPGFAEIRPGFDLASAAVFMCEPALFENQKLKRAKNFSTDVFEPLCRNSPAPIFAYRGENGFRHDVGSITRLVEANMRVLDREWPLRIPGREVRAGIWVGENVSYRGATLLPPLCLGSNVRVGKGARLGPHVVIGNGCQIDNEARITNSILMEHCRIAKRAEIVESIIGPHSEIAEMVKLPAKTTLGAYSQVGDNFQTRRTP